MWLYCVADLLIYHDLPECVIFIECEINIMRQINVIFEQVFKNLLKDMCRQAGPGASNSNRIDGLIIKSSWYIVAKCSQTSS
jgi:hypothetical protein